MSTLVETSQPMLEDDGTLSPWGLAWVTGAARQLEADGRVYVSPRQFIRGDGMVTLRGERRDHTRRQSLSDWITEATS